MILEMTVMRSARRECRVRILPDAGMSAEDERCFQMPAGLEQTTFAGGRQKQEMEMYATELMKQEHDLASGFLLVVKKACLNAMDNGSVNVDDFRTFLDIARNFVDKIHHGKEEDFLFNVMTDKLGRIAVNLVQHGMLVEHEMCRGHLMDLENALNDYEKTGSKESRLDIIESAAGYVRLLQRHVDKENTVVYPFADRSLSKEDQDAIDANVRAFEAESAHEQAKEHYTQLIHDLMARYGVAKKET